MENGCCHCECLPYAMLTSGEALWHEIRLANELSIKKGVAKGHDI